MQIHLSVSAEIQRFAEQSGVFQLAEIQNTAIYHYYHILVYILYSLQSIIFIIISYLAVPQSKAAETVIYTECPCNAGFNRSYLICKS